jgi:hypothetical protein
MDHPDKNINTETSELNCIIDQMDLIDIYKLFHQTTAGNTVYSVDHGTFTKIHHILSHKSCLNKYKKMKIFSCSLSDDNAIKLDINSKRSYRNFMNTSVLHNTL